MAQMPIEVVRIGNVSTVNIEQAMSLANSIQKEFVYVPLKVIEAQAFSMLAYKRVTAEDFLNSMESRRSFIRGFHPFMIALVDAELDGKVYTNLFGSHRASKGVAVFSVSNVEDVVIPQGCMAAYYLYYFARYTLSFVAPDHKNHDETKECVFDRKVNKLDIIRSMKARAICDDCRNALLSDNNILTPAQFVALDALFETSGKVLEGKPIPSSGTSAVAEQIDRVKLREALATSFSEGELHDLCFDLNVDYETLPGVGKGDKIRELIAYLERRGQLSRLLNACSRLRTNVSW